MTAPTAARIRSKRHLGGADHPISEGLCRYCLREMWVGDGRTQRRLSPCGDRHPGACETCGTWMDRNPGRDPRDGRSIAEVLPAERGEADPRWRHDPDRRCAGADPVVFEPEPDDDDPAWQDRALRASLASARRNAARAHCLPCPLREVCRERAQAHQYEGLWGGVFFTRRTWVDLLTGEQGRTSTPAPLRDRDRTRRSA